MTMSPALNVSFLLCDDVRMEQGNKLSFMGVYAGDDLVLHGAKPGGALSNLSLVITVKGNTKDLDGEYEMRGPHGNVVQGQKGLKIESKMQNTSLVFKYQPFPLPDFGIYSVIAKFDNQSYQYQFDIKSS